MPQQLVQRREGRVDQLPEIHHLPTHVRVARVERGRRKEIAARLAERGLALRDDECLLAKPEILAEPLRDVLVEWTLGAE